MAPRAVDEDQFDSALRQLGQRTERVYLHIDLDALDEREGRANEYAAANGPSLSRLRDCVGETMRRFNVLAAALTAYDPAYDPDGRVRNAARQLLKDLATGLNTRQQRLSCPQ
jgi:arginase